MSVKRLCVLLFFAASLLVQPQALSQSRRSAIDVFRFQIHRLEEGFSRLGEELRGLWKPHRPDLVVIPSQVPDTLAGNEHLREGFPGGMGRVLDKRFFVILYDGREKIPRWVGYHLTREELEEGEARRSEDFRPDPELPPQERSELSDYRGSGFDRGHQAPAADFRRSEEAMATTFLLSNMAPQTPELNRGIWARLEDGVRRLTEREGSVWIFTGTLFLNDEGRPVFPSAFIGHDSVAVPTHFFKAILCDLPHGRHEMFAFILPNAREKLEGPLTGYQVSVDSVQRISGLDFFSELPDSEEQMLEHEVDPRWETEAARP